MTRTVLSESHNFGHHVYLEDGLVFKMRDTFWEKVFLSPNPFRNRLSDSFLHSNLPNPFSLLPILDFGQLDQNLFTMQFVDVAPANYVGEVECAQLGSLMALLAWFGVTDLTAENMRVGYLNGTFVATPVDIEVLGYDLALLSETLLLPSRKLPKEKCGLSDILCLLKRESSKTLAPLVSGYLSAGTFLKTNEAKFDQIFADEIKNDQIIRVLLRKSQTYQNFMDGKEYESEFATPPLPSELAQMARGDIPYYFRFADDLSIYHYVEDGLPARSEVNDMIEFQPPNVNVMRKLRTFSPRINSDKLVESGALQICKALCSAGEIVNSSYEKCRVSSNGERIFVNYCEQTKLTCNI